MAGFVGTVAVSSLLLSAGTFLLVKADRRASSEARAADEVAAQLAIAKERARTEGIEPALDRLLAHYTSREAGDVVITGGDFTRYSSQPLGEAALGHDLSHQPTSSSPARINVVDRPYLVLSEPITNEFTAHFFFSERRMAADLSRVVWVLVSASSVLIVIAVAVGRIVAQRVLRPVGEASATATEIAAGRLDARLPSSRPDEFGGLAVAFNHMTDVLTDKMAELGSAHERERNFAADFSHEVRTPLAAVANDTYLLAESRDQLPDEPRRLCELLEQDVGRLVSLSEEMIDLREAVDESRTESPQIVNLRELILDVVDGFPERHSIEVDIPQNLTATCALLRLRRVVGNLISNAIRHGGRGIRVHAESDRDGIRLIVSDEGEGIPADELPRIFDRFYQVDPARSSEGTGLGLAIAAADARASGMSLSASSEAGKGATFVLHLP